MFQLLTPRVNNFLPLPDLCFEIFQLCAELVQLCRGQEDDAECLDHVRGKFHVLFMQQDLGAASVDVLRPQQQTQLPGGGYTMYIILLYKLFVF